MFWGDQGVKRKGFSDFLVGLGFFWRGVFLGGGVGSKQFEVVGFYDGVVEEFLGGGLCGGEGGFGGRSFYD
jgi:hypothetical protein